MSRDELGSCVGLAFQGSLPPASRLLIHCWSIIERIHSTAQEPLIKIMSRYTHESPMDFEFQNGTGPMDARSPFAQISQNSQRFPSAAGGAKKSTFDGSPESSKVWQLTIFQSGSYSAFDSPAKSRSNQPLSPSKPLPPTPAAFNGLFSTPRKSNVDYDDSSAGETPRSPEGKDDSDATPDLPKARSSALSRFDPSSLPTLAGAERMTSLREVPSAARRDSWMMRVKQKLYSPGRGEVPRPDYSHEPDKRVEKRRKRDASHKVSRRRRRSMSDSAEDSPEIRHNHVASPRKTSSSSIQQEPAPAVENKPNWISSLFTFIASHPTVPHILSFYAQLLFNLFLLSTFAYLIYCFWSAVQGDVDKKSHEAMADIMAEMAICAQEYRTNKCDRTTRLPALEVVCENWSKCVNRDASKIGRAKVSAHTFAEIFNSFVEPISYKAMVFSAILVFGCFGISNFAFGFLRNKETSPGTQFHAPYFQQQQPPPTPQRTFSGRDGANGGFYGTPWQNQPHGLEPQPSASYGQIDGRGSPVRRLAYN